VTRSCAASADPARPFVPPGPPSVIRTWPSTRVAPTPCDPRVLERALNTALDLKPNVGDVMATGAFPAATNDAQLQRVANLMLRYGQLRHPFSIRSITGP
jgi:hypothetical protein